MLALILLTFFASGCARSLTYDSVAQADAAADIDVTVESVEPDVVAAGQAAESQPSIEITYKLDPRLTSGMYMGDRWVSPRTYDTVQTGDTFVVEAAATVRGPDGREIIAQPEWIARDPDMVTVAPGQGGEVTITVKAAGESSLEIASQGVSRTLLIKATIPRPDAIRVAITQ